jgi:hypothetical protein
MSRGWSLCQFLPQGKCPEHSRPVQQQLTEADSTSATAQKQQPDTAEQQGLVSHPVFKDKTKCITICMSGSSSIHIVTSLVNNQQQYHEKRIKRLQTYPGNKDSKLHRQSTVGCAGLELSIVFERLHITFSSEQQL